MKPLYVLFVLSVSSLAAQTGHAVTLNWNWSESAGGPATGFNVKRSLVTGGPYALIGTVGSPTTTSYVDMSTAGNILLERVTYFYVVTAIGPEGESAPSNEASATIPSTTPSLTIASALSPLPSVTGASPASGSGLTQSFTFTFSDTAGWQSLGILDILINDFLDGRHACYIAYVIQSRSVLLVDDNGDAGGPFAGGMVLNNNGSISNSQCTVNGAGSTAVGSGQTLTLTLNITFHTGFAGNRIFYLAARDTGTGNSGWQALGTWNVPGATPVGPAVGGVSPGRSAAAAQTYSFTFTDTNGFADLNVLDILVNNSFDGIRACYVAYVPTSATTGYIYLVNDAGNGQYVAGSPLLLSSGGTLQNSQCTINTAGSSAFAIGDTLTLNLTIAFNTAGFAGNQVFYLAARNATTGNSGWQAVGSVTVP